MNWPRCKICGITRPQDALLAANLGVTAIGMVFHEPAKRNVTIARARQILAVLPPFMTAVGVFVDRTAAQVREIAMESGLRHVQLHGHEAPEMVAELAPLVVIKAIRVAGVFGNELAHWRQAIRKYRLSNLCGLVLETGNTTEAGGTGIANDWEAIAAAQKAGNFKGLPPMIVAGGLTAQNVAAVIRLLHPWAVDVSSGVELSPGRKSARKMERFLAAVEAAG